MLSNIVPVAPRKGAKAAKTAVAAGLLALVAACASPSSDSVYQSYEVGQQSNVQFGTIVSSQPILVQGENNGFGAVAGGVLGGIGGSAIGGGVGQSLATAGGAILGTMLGNYAQQKIENRNGVQYVVLLQNGQTVTISQTLNSGDQVFPPNTRVAVQQSGGYQRVINANSLPTTMQRPQGITVTN